MQFGIFSVSDVTRDPTTGITPSEAERIDATVRIAEGGAALLPFKLMAPALALMAVMMIVYIRRMFTLPGKIIRGEV